MSYPSPRYHGAGGEISAIFRRASTPPELVLGGSSAASYLATGALTNGDYGLYRWDMSGERSGAAAHFHRSFSESFFILSGTVEIFDGADWHEAGPGDFVYVPEGGIHAFRNESGAAASMLILFAPGAPREGYFEGLPGLGDLTDEQRAAFFTEHDTFWT